MTSLLERINVKLNKIAIKYYGELQELSNEGSYIHRMSQRRIQKKQAYDEAVLED